MNFRKVFNMIVNTIVLDWYSFQCVQQSWHYMGQTWNDENRSQSHERTFRKTNSENC